MKLAIESLILAIIGLLDLASTLFLVHHHGADEANPIFRYYLSLGPAWFAAIKIVMIAGPIALLEWARRARPRFTTVASRFAILAYVGMYVVGVARLNPDLMKRHQLNTAYVAVSQNAQLIDLDGGAEVDDEGAVIYLPADPKFAIHRAKR